MAKKDDDRETFGAARLDGGDIFLNIGSAEITLTEEQWLTLVAAASAGGNTEGRYSALLSFHRSIAPDLSIMERTPVGLVELG